MSDLSYRLVVDMGARGSLGPQLERVGARAKSIDSQLSSLGTSFTESIGAAASAFTGVVERAASAAMTLGKLAAVGTGAAIGYGVAHLNNELEKTQISLATILNAQLGTGMEAGLRMSSELMRDMRRDAAALPGELKDLQQFFKLGATPGFQLGATPRQLEKLSGLGMAAAAATGVQMDQAAREFTQLLQGRAGAHNVFGSMLGFTGDAAAKFNKLQGQDRLRALETELRKYESSIEVFGESFEAVSSTLKDNARQVLQRGTAPLFTRVKEEMGAANKWFTQHQRQIERAADFVGEKLLAGFDRGKRAIREWGPAIGTFALNAAGEVERIFVRVEPILKRLGAIIRTELGDPKLFRHLERGAGIYGGVKVAGALAPIAKPAISGMGSVLGGAATALGIPEIGVMAALAPLLIATAGAFHVLMDASAPLHAFATSTLGSIVEHMGGYFAHVGHILELIGPDLIKVGDLMGVALLMGLRNIAWVLEQCAAAADFAVTKFYSVAAALHIISEQPGPGAAAGPASEGGPPAWWTEFTAKLHGEGQPFGPPAPSALDTFMAGLQKTKAGGGGGGGGTSIQKVEIVVSSNQDPSRIARLTVDRLTDISKFPTSSPKVRNFSATR